MNFLDCTKLKRTSVICSIYPKSIRAKWKGRVNKMMKKWKSRIQTVNKWRNKVRSGRYKFTQIIITLHKLISSIKYRYRDNFNVQIRNDYSFTNSRSLKEIIKEKTVLWYCGYYGSYVDECSAHKEVWFHHPGRCSNSISKWQQRRCVDDPNTEFSVDSNTQLGLTSLLHVYR